MTAAQSAQLKATEKVMAFTLSPPFWLGGSSPVAAPP